MEPLTGICAAQTCHQRQHDALAALCARGGGRLRAWRIAREYERTFAVVEGSIDERAAAAALECAIAVDRPPALYLAAEARDENARGLVEELVTGAGAPSGVQATPHGDGWILRVAVERTPLSLLRDLLEIELRPRGTSCTLQLLSPIPLELVVRMAAHGLGARIDSSDVLEALL